MFVIYNEKIFFIIIPAIIISVFVISYLALVIYLSPGDFKEPRLYGDMWSIDYENSYESFPLDSVNEELSIIFNESNDKDYVINFLSPDDYYEFLPHSTLSGHVYTDHTYGLHLEKSGRDHQENQIQEMLEAIPGVKKVTFVTSFVY